MRRFVQRSVGMVTALAALSLPASAAIATPAGAAPGWTLDRVVVVMRHGVRPPTKAEALPEGLASAPWPAWDVGWGELSHHGEQAVALLGTFDRASYGGLLGSGCPAVRAVADSDQRTVRTAEVYVAALLPGCTVSVDHKATGETDPRFSSAGETSSLSSDQALAAANAALPRGGTAQLDHDLSPDWTSIDRILGCRAPACIAAHPTSLSTTGGKVKLGGALALGGSFSETLALEYADAQPMTDVGWGRVTRDEITRLLALHSWEFAVKARPPLIARAGAAALLDQVATALSAPDAPVFSVFVGHDTNMALIGGALGLHWHAPQFAVDDPPPGGALIFERWRSASGRYRLVLRFRSQSLEEMRTLAPLTPEALQPVIFAPCDDGIGCDAPGLRQALSSVEASRR
ncbi:histidine-type phosphatase [Sphingomonas abietis]|uniref:Histidine-type phosphatase n=1 Tax=Sphingomonas abietis TaxID=3012344 RepID=A0ABY7NJ93_9SPHN|nr:histidine-type phosphatase [Sphingomonas abietis]WBO20698.1 histidine-type phosphatase [Sphingomonas abietis]